jgi:Zn-dependent peptidase ImmA (M78 family)
VEGDSQVNPKHIDHPIDVQSARRTWEKEKAGHVKAVSYDPETQRLVVELVNGSSFAVPVSNIQGLEGATSEQLSNVEVSPSGDGLRWDELDVDMDVVALQAGVFGTKSWMAHLGEMGGRMSSPSKAMAARANGQKGGRPHGIATAFWKRLSEAGLERNFILDRLVPKSLMASWAEANQTKAKDELVPQIAEYLKAIYSWSLDDILGNQDLTFAKAAQSSARFKMPSNTNERRAGAYVVYAHYLALLALETTSHLSQKRIETDPKAIRNLITSRYGELNLKTALQYVWGCGTTVLPLFDSGAFHGACWRTGGRNVIVLKQKSNSEARWLFDLLHEDTHTSEHPERNEFEVIEQSENSKERRDSPEEQAASQRAGDIILDGRAEELTDLCVNYAQGSVEFLKKAVQRVAAQENVSVSSLANYVAFRLSLQRINWWGTASNLQETTGNPGDISRQLFLQHANLDVLNELDRHLLERALALD